MTRDELIKRLEAGQVGRRIDGEISIALGADRYRNWYSDAERQRDAWHVRWKPDAEWELLPFYSAPKNRAETVAALLRAEGE
jgi:hypothetical protein